MKKLLGVLALGAAFAATDAMAWGGDGHRVVGAIADQLLKGSNAQRRLDALLLPGENLENISNWADCVKGSYCGPHTPEMTEYVTANPKHQEYHYTDIPFQNARYFDGEVGSDEHDVVQTLKQAIIVLQGKGDDASNPHHFTQRQALMLIAHMAGDIHQPLHVGDAYLDKAGKFVAPERAGQIDGVNIFDSNGGNNLQLDDAKLTAMAARVMPPALPKEGDEGKSPFPKSATKPFHSYWDSTTVDYAMRRAGARTPEQYAQMLIAGKPTVAGNSGDPATWPYQWADDALVEAKVTFTDVAVGKSTQMTSRSGGQYTVWAAELPESYLVPSAALAKEQLTKGGYHLAALLRAIWP